MDKFIREDPREYYVGKTTMKAENSWSPSIREKTMVKKVELHGKENDFHCEDETSPVR